MTAPPPPTADQVVDGITAALAAGDVDVVPSLLHLLAVTDARRAQEVYDQLQLGLAIAHAASPTHLEH